MKHVIIGKNRGFWKLHGLLVISLGLYWAIWFRKVVKEFKAHVGSAPHLRIPNENLGLVAWFLCAGGFAIAFGFNETSFASDACGLGIFMFFIGICLYVILCVMLVQAVGQHYVDNSAFFLADSMARAGMAGDGFQIADPDTDLTVVRGAIIGATDIGSGILGYYIPARREIRMEFGYDLLEILLKIPFSVGFKDLQETLNRHWDFHRRQQDYMGYIIEYKDWQEGANREIQQIEEASKSANGEPLDLDADALCDKADALSDAQRYKEALKVYDEAIKKEPNFLRAHYNKGYTLDKMKRYKEALQCFDNVLTVDSSRHQAWCEKGGTYIKMKRYNDGIQCLDQATTIKPDYILAWDRKAYAYGELMDLPNVVRCYDAILQIDPYNQDAITWREAAIQKMGYRTR